MLQHVVNSDIKELDKFCNTYKIIITNPEKLMKNNLVNCLFKKLINCNKLRRIHFDECHV